MKNNHDCLGVMQSLEYKSPNKLVLKREGNLDREREKHRYRDMDHKDYRAL